ncbi:p53 and DNA damage-regulated protein 1 [Coemansia pectinata]|uniref:P53 and DNA damage-regulated protein 1 n=1 Tax=Coemansia pectinata TaxID=1052879 RepID=A0A9W8H5R1_9FUNG|nr:p53 and DNA damage-regulated protein 1 [Coemansia pectinata]
MEAVEYQAKVEALAEDILTDKQLAIDYDRKRQENREALRSLREQSQKSKPNSVLATTTVNMGDFFIQLPLPKAQKMMEEAQAELDKAIDDVRQRLKAKVKLLGELEGDEKLVTVAKAMDLKSVSGQDLYGISR